MRRCWEWRAPRDPVNVLLSFAYSLQARELTVTALAVGFDPYLGFYHRPMQSALIELINRREDRIILVDVGPIDGRGSDSIESVGRAISLIDHRRPVIV